MENRHAIFLMTLSMAGFALGDTFVKLTSAHFSVAQVLIGMAIPGTLLFSLLAARAGQSVFSPEFFSRPVLTRNIVEGFAAIFMVSALASAPLSLVIAITQAVPLFVTLGAALLLGESVGPRRWAAVLIGLFGVLIMLRPDTSGLSLGAVFALLAALGLATRDLITRITPPKVGTLQMSAWGTFALLPAGLILLPLGGPHPEITWAGLWLVLIAAMVNAVGYYTITAAMRIGDVSAVTPFRYSRLIFALIIAVLFFGERPDALTLLGAFIVIGSGLFVMWRERVVKSQG